MSWAPTSHGPRMTTVGTARTGRPAVEHRNPVATNLLVLKPDVAFEESVSPIAAAPSRKPWDSFFAWLFASSLAVVLPSIFLALFVNLAQSWLWLGVGAMLVAAVLALSTWLVARPVLELSRAAAGVDGGDLWRRAIPGGGSQTRRLA